MSAIGRMERERDAALQNMRDGWTALRMIREAVETLGPVGCMVSEEHTACAVAPTPQAEAEAIIAGIQNIATLATAEMRDAAQAMLGAYDRFIFNGEPARLRAALAAALEEPK